MDTFVLNLLIVLKVKNLSDFTNLFSPNKYEKNDKIILKYFQYFPFINGFWNGDEKNLLYKFYKYKKFKDT